ncbi:MAG: cysteine desulfurase [Clostridia bacterium]|nr:cysteine desulfurase [Clostridia bacterium]
MAVYFDNSATTPLCPEAVRAMAEAMEAFGNPSSRHQLGVSAGKAVREAREAVLRSLGVRGGREENLIFTASGTEADNLAILGTARAKKNLAGKKVITSDTEHPAVLRCMEQLDREGFQVCRIPTRGGLFDLDRFSREMTEDTFLVSVMLVNNETGQVNDIRAIRAIAKERNPDVCIHTDAVQGYLHLPFTPEKLGADLVSVSAHKIHGPKGIGALYVSPYCVKRRTLSPVIFGGGQEGGFRSGTENTIGIAGFGAAAAVGFDKLTENREVMEDLRRYLIEAIRGDPSLSGIRINLPKSAEQAPHILSLTVPGIRSEVMLNWLSGKGICVSSGSACSSHSERISRTLLAFGLSPEEADSTIRVSLSHRNTREEAAALLSALREGMAVLYNRN